MTDDGQWATLARRSREALASLGYRIEEPCLPDEAAPCGAGWELHAVAQLATLRALTDHHLAHLGAGDAFAGTARDVYAHAAAIIAADCERGEGVL